MRETLCLAVLAAVLCLPRGGRAGEGGRADGAQPPRGGDGSGEVTVTGELQQWHKVTLTLAGPFAHERDVQPNPFTDYRFSVVFTHASGSPRYVVPGYFAADGDAANSGAESGTQWRAHLSPDKPGRWDYAVEFARGKHAALGGGGTALEPFDGGTGSFVVAAQPTPAGSEPPRRDFRADGRLQYVGERYLRFAESGRYFLKAGADSPETLLAYVGFDGTVAAQPDRVPLKTWEPHVRDWRAGDPTWRDGRGKGLIGALNYLSRKGANAFSFLTYNAGGDGDNVWPFVERDAKLHYDCSKLDQWGIVFDHATDLGLYLHFKMQETENDDDVPESLDGGKLGPQRKLYCRELVARFAHNLALNWNLGEENTQSTAEIHDMIGYLRTHDPYQHPVVVHTYPDQQDKVYEPLLGKASQLTGVSLQNSDIRDCHSQVVHWVRRSAAAGHPWVVAFDEPGDATFGMPPDEGWPGMRELRAAGEADRAPTVDETRKYVLWGTLLGGGGGVEYYFGYKLPENDLLCEDWRSRDRSWEYCRIALDFFSEQRIPVQRMEIADALVGNSQYENSRYCLAAPGELYLVYLPTGGRCDLDLSAAEGQQFTVQWFNPRRGGPLVDSAVATVTGGAPVSLGAPPVDPAEDWLAVVRVVP